MRHAVLLSLFLPIILACDNPDQDSCAAAITASSAIAASFCATYTQTKNTATTGLPAFVASCSNKPSKISSACSCLMTAKAALTTLKTLSTTTKPTTTVATTPKVATITAKSSTFAKADSSTTKPKSSTSSTKVSTMSSTKASIIASTFTAVKSSSTTSKPSSIVAGSACTCTAYSQIASAVASCSNIVLQDIAVPANSAIDLTKVKSGATITFAGKTTFGTTKNSDFDPIQLGGTNVIIQGATGHVIDGNGQAYWDGQGSNGGIDKPNHFITVSKMQSSTIQNLNIQNYPVHCFDITNCNDLKISNIVLDNSAGDAPNSASGSKAAAHNTDGFDISRSTNIFLASSTVRNQDDCVAITSGTNITVTQMSCSGGHGLSIGSVGGKSDNTVTDITFSNSTVTNSQNGCRIKTNSGTTGAISDITYRDIVLSGITNYGIDVQQDYLNGGPTGSPTNGVTIKGVTFDSVTGTVNSKALNYYILCGSGSCSDFTFTSVGVTGGKSSSCNYPSSTCP